MWSSHQPWNGRERSLPDGLVHLVVRVTGPAVEIDGEELGTAVVGGPRAVSWLRRADASARTVGVTFAPGAAGAFLGVPAGALAGRHTRVDDLPALRGLGERLQEAGDDAARALAEELRRRWDGSRPDPRVVRAATDLPGEPEEVVAERVGLGVRRLRDLFREAVGLTPRDHRRVTRLQRVLADTARHPARPWGDRAHLFGFCDQAHLSREFQAMTGTCPTRYAPRPGQPNHVPVPMDPSGRARRG